MSSPSLRAFWMTDQLRYLVPQLLVRNLEMKNIDLRSGAPPDFNRL
jgi:hypothetical protein